MTDSPIDDTEAREQDAPGTTDAKHRAPVHGHTGDVPSDKALSDSCAVGGSSCVRGGLFLYTLRAPAGACDPHPSPPRELRTHTFPAARAPRPHRPTDPARTLHTAARARRYSARAPSGVGGE
eukprot:scaffold16013_cov153-Isochrysis_galbana.AAC.1